MRQLGREGRPGLRLALQRASEFRKAAITPDGEPVLGIYTKPDRDRLWKVLVKYARGLHFWSTRDVLPVDAIPSIERIFNMQTRPAVYWEPMLAAAAYARAGSITTVGKQAEFTLAFRSVEKGDALSVMVLDFYRSFPYVALMMKPGSDFSRPVLLPF